MEATNADFCISGRTIGLLSISYGRNEKSRGPTKGGFARSRQGGPGWSYVLQVYGHDSNDYGLLLCFKQDRVHR
jgi:hypothetical protein